MKLIPYSRQDINTKDISNVIKTLKSDFITQGPKIKEFEKKICDYTKGKFAVATNSATSALHISCLALGLKNNDIVWTVPNSFVATSNCALMCGAKIDFVDIDPVSYNISISSLEKKLLKAKKEKKIPKILIVVHFAGNPCDMKEIYKFKKKYRFKIIEDASHALGAKYYRNKIGSCIYSDITVFSFHPVKMITTGEGGVAVTNQKKTFNLMQLYRDHGIKRFVNKKKKWLYNQVLLGFNYRITDIQCALGISQFSKLDSWVKRRNYLAERYSKMLSDLPLILPKIYSKKLSSFHLYVIKIDTARTNIKRDFIFNYLRNKNIMVNVHYIPIYRHLFYKKLNFKKKNFPECEKYYNNVISIPLFPSLTTKDQNKIIKEIKSIFLHSLN